jgi:hypothetical protein
MKKCMVVVGMLAIAALLAPNAGAAGMDPLGGSLYVMQRRMNDADCATYLNLRSLQFDANWNLVGWRVQGDFKDNASTPNRYQHGWDVAVGMLSPEVETYGGQSYGTIVMGAYYNNSPVAGNPPYQTMDILQIKPVSSGTAAVTILGNGRKFPDGSGGWGTTIDPPTKATEVASIVAPDPAGGFTGGAGKYFVQGDIYGTCFFIVQNTNPGTDCDCTNDDADYIASRGRSNEFDGRLIDFEILGSKFMTSTGWDGKFVGPNSHADTITYIKKTGPTTFDTTRYPFVVGNRGGVVPGVGVDVSLNAGSAGFAAGTVQGHDAVWSVASTPAGGLGLYAFIDKNDNGIISSSEVFKIYDSTSASFPTFQNQDDPTGNWSDLEWVKNSAGKMFFIAVNRSSNWDVGRSILILELDDNGGFSDAANHAKLFTEYQPGTGKGTQNFDLGDQYYRVTGWSAGMTYRNLSIEFDPNVSVIPEPATLMLIGTGVLGAFSWLRRRKMK